MKKQIVLNRLRWFFYWKGALICNALFSILGGWLYLGYVPMSNQCLALVVGGVCMMGLGIVTVHIFHFHYFKDGLKAALKKEGGYMVFSIPVLALSRVIAMYVGQHDRAFTFEVVQYVYVFVWTMFALIYFKLTEKVVSFPVG